MTAILLLVAGYAVALPVLSRLRSVFAQRRVGWFTALEGAMVSIIVGWWLREQPAGVVINAAAAVGLGAAWWITGRRRAELNGSR